MFMSVYEYSMISIISTGSIKRTGLAIILKFLLNVPYDLIFHHVFLNVLVSIKCTGFEKYFYFKYLQISIRWSNFYYKYIMDLFKMLNMLLLFNNVTHCKAMLKDLKFPLSILFFQVFLSIVLVSIIMTPKRTVSIKCTGFKIFKIFLLNVPYDLKNFPFCNYKTSTYNRNHRVIFE